MKYSGPARGSRFPGAGPATPGFPSRGHLPGDEAARNPAAPQPARCPARRTHRAPPGGWRPPRGGAVARGHQGRLMPTRPHRAATPGGRTWGPARPQHPAGQRGPGPAPAHTASRGRRARLLVWPGPPHGPSWGPLCPPCPTRGDSGNPGPHPNTRARSRHTHTCRMRTHRHAHQCTHTTWVPWFCATSRDPGTGLLPHEKPRLAGPAGTPAPEAGAPHSSRPGSPRPPPAPGPPRAVAGFQAASPHPAASLTLTSCPGGPDRPFNHGAGQMCPPGHLLGPLL